MNGTEQRNELKSLFSKLRDNLYVRSYDVDYMIELTVVEGEFLQLLNDINQSYSSLPTENKGFKEHIYPITVGINEFNTAISEFKEAKANNFKGDKDVSTYATKIDDIVSTFDALHEATYEFIGDLDNEIYKGLDDLTHKLAKNLLTICELCTSYRRYGHYKDKINNFNKQAAKSLGSFIDIIKEDVLNEDEDIKKLIEGYIKEGLLIKLNVDDSDNDVYEKLKAFVAKFKAGKALADKITPKLGDLGDLGDDIAKLKEFSTNFSNLIKLAQEIRTEVQNKKNALRITVDNIYTSIISKLSAEGKESAEKEKELDNIKKVITYGLEADDELDKSPIEIVLILIDELPNLDIKGLIEPKTQEIKECLSNQVKTYLRLYNSQSPKNVDNELRSAIEEYNSVIADSKITDGMEVDVLKIDKEFRSLNLDGDEDDKIVKVVKRVIELCKDARLSAALSATKLKSTSGVIIFNSDLAITSMTEIDHQLKLLKRVDLKEMAEALVNLTVKDVKELRKANKDVQAAGTRVRKGMQELKRVAAHSMVMEYIRFVQLDKRMEFDTIDNAPEEKERNMLNILLSPLGYKLIYNKGDSSFTLKNKNPDNTLIVNDTLEAGYEIEYSLKETGDVNVIALYTTVKYDTKRSGTLTKGPELRPTGAKPDGTSTGETGENAGLLLRNFESDLDSLYISANDLDFFSEQLQSRSVTNLNSAHERKRYGQWCEFVSSIISAQDKKEREGLIVQAEIAVAVNESDHQAKQRAVSHNSSRSNISRLRELVETGLECFEISERAKRTGRNPQTGKEIKIASKSSSQPVEWGDVKEGDKTLGNSIDEVPISEGLNDGSVIEGEGIDIDDLVKDIKWDKNVGLDVALIDSKQSELPTFRNAKDKERFEELTKLNDYPAMEDEIIMRLILNTLYNSENVDDLRSECDDSVERYVEFINATIDDLNGLIRRRADIQKPNEIDKIDSDGLKSILEGVKREYQKQGESLVYFVKADSKDDEPDKNTVITQDEFFKLTVKAQADYNKTMLKVEGGQKGGDEGGEVYTVETQLRDGTVKIRNHS